MSVSTVEGPEYNRFYGSGQSSDSSSSEDASSQRTGVRRRRQPSRDGQGSIFQSFMKPFRSCCFTRDGNYNFSSSKQAAPPNLSPQRGRSAYADPYGGLGGILAGGAGGSESEASGTTSGGGTFVDIPRGAKPMVVEPAGPGGHRRLSNMPEPGEELDPEEAAAWSVKLKANSYYAEQELTIGQQQFSVVSWCIQNEQSSLMTERLLNFIARRATMASKDFKAETELKKDDYALVELVRRIEARNIGEVLADLDRSVNELEGTGALYVLFSRQETAVGVCARKQGEVNFLSAFDPKGVSGKRGPSFFGFNKVEDMGKFVSNLFVGGGAQRFEAYIMKSRHVYLPAEAQILKEWAKTPTVAAAKGDEGEKGDKLDPQREARIVYSAMYDAAKRPTDQERVFSWAPQAGMNVQTGKEAPR